MLTVRRNIGIGRVSLVIALLFMGAFAALSEPVHAETWGELYHGPWTEWWTGTTFYGTLRTSDGGYLLTGTSNNRGVILKVSSDGTLQWSKLVKGNGYQKDTYLIGAVESSNGDFIVTGQVYADSTINPDATAGSWDIYIIRLTSSGAAVWEKVYARKNVGSVPDTHEAPQYIYKSCPEVGGSCSYVVTGYVIYSGVLDCIYSGYRASQTLVIDDNGAVQNDFLMAGPSATGDGAVKTIYTNDGNYLVLTEQANPVAGYTIGLQKYGPTGSLLWSKAYYEAYHQEDGDHLLKISAGAVVETGSGYVLAGSTYNSVTEDPPLGAYYHFTVDKATGSTVKWNKKFRAWADWNSLWVLNFAKTPDGGLVATIGDGVTTANDRIFKTSQTNGGLLWVNEYGANLGTVSPGPSDLAVATSAYDALLARLSVDGNMGKSCTALPISDKTSEATPHQILRTDVHEGFSQSGCNSGVGRVTAYTVGLTDTGEYHQANSCAPFPQLSVTSNGNFGTVAVGSSGGYDITVGLSNYNGLSNLDLRNVALSDATNFSIVSDSCSGKTLYPVNQGNGTYNCSVSVRFSPGSNGLKNCAVKFPSNNESLIKAALKGTGTGASILTVTISPGAAVTAGAMWRVDGGTWKKSGAKVQLPPGTHVVSFKYVTGWQKPANKTVTTVSGQTKTVAGKYVILP